MKCRARIRHVQSDEQLRSEIGRQLDDVHAQLATRRLDELRPHPSYSRHGLAVSASQLSALTALDDRVSQEPIATMSAGLDFASIRSASAACGPQKPLRVEICMTPGADSGFSCDCSKELCSGFLLCAKLIS